MRPTESLASRAPLWGRDDELRRLDELLREPGALVSVTGVAGVGKSALARAALEDSSVVGLRCDLAGLDDAASVRRQLAPGKGAPSWDRVAKSLCDRGVQLLLLDDVEDTELARDTCRELRARLPELSLLLTTPCALALGAERTLALGCLRHPLADEGELDPARWPALGLWLELTRELGCERDLRHAARLVRELDGLPLALTLAAPRALLQGEELLLDCLEQRFDVLRRRGEGRHDSLARAFERLWATLPEPTRRDVAGLARFPSGFTLDSGAAVLGLERLQFWDTLEELVERGLVEADPAPGQRTRRFHLLRSLGAFVELDATRADAAKESARSHALFFTHWASATPDFAELRAEAANIEAALTWLDGLAAPSPEEREAQLLGLMAQVRLRWATGPHGELAERLEAALEAAADEVTARTRVEARVAQGADLRRAGELERAAEALRRGLEQAGQDQELRRAVTGELAAVEAAMGETREAEEALEAAIAEGGEDEARIKLQIRLADLLHRHSTHRRARELLEAAVEGAEAGSHAELEVSARLNLANVCASEQAFDEARGQLERASERAHAMGHGYFEAYALLSRAVVEQLAGADEARALALEASAKLEALGHARDAGVAESQLSLMALESKDVPGALSHARKALRLMSEHAIPFVALTRARYAAALAEAGRLEDAEEEWRGARASLESDAASTEAVAARVHSGHLDLSRARRALDAGDEDAARAQRQRAEEALRSPSHAQEMASEVRLAQRTLRACLERSPAASGGLLVNLDGREFTPMGEERVNLSRRGALRRILARLAEALKTSPGVGVDPDGIFEAGWPGQSIHPEQAGARVYNAIFELRRMGLGDRLLRHDDGYLLSPEQVRVAEPTD